MKYLTAQMLRRAGACESGVALFNRTFGGCAEVTSENARRALEVGLRFEWAARTFLSEHRWRVFERTAASIAEDRALAERLARAGFQEAARAAHRERIAAARRQFTRASDHDLATKSSGPARMSTTKRKVLNRHARREMVRELAGGAERDPAVEAAAQVRDWALAEARDAQVRAVAEAFVIAFRP